MSLFLFRHFIERYYNTSSSEFDCNLKSDRVRKMAARCVTVILLGFVFAAAFGDLVEPAPKLVIDDKITVGSFGKSARASISNPFEMEPYEEEKYLYREVPIEGKLVSYSRPKRSGLANRRVITPKNYDEENGRLRHLSNTVDHEILEPRERVRNGVFYVEGGERSHVRFFDASASGGEGLEAEDETGYRQSEPKSAKKKAVLREPVRKRFEPGYFDN